MRGGCLSPETMHAFYRGMSSAFYRPHLRVPRKCTRPRSSRRDARDLVVGRVRLRCAAARRRLRGQPCRRGASRRRLPRRQRQVLFLLREGARQQCRRTALPVRGPGLARGERRVEVRPDGHELSRAAGALRAPGPAWLRGPGFPVQPVRRSGARLGSGDPSVRRQVRGNVRRPTRQRARVPATADRCANIAYTPPRSFPMFAKVDVNGFNTHPAWVRLLPS